MISRFKRLKKTNGQGKGQSKKVIISYISCDERSETSEAIYLINLYIYNEMYWWIVVIFSSNRSRSACRARKIKSRPSWLVSKAHFQLFLISTIKLGIDLGNNISVDNILFPYEFFHFDSNIRAHLSFQPKT